jgi:hypothetical protein
MSTTVNGIRFYHKKNLHTMIHQIGAQEKVHSRLWMECTQEGNHKYDIWDRMSSKV